MLMMLQEHWAFPWPPDKPIFTGTFVPVDSVSPSEVNWFLKEDPRDLVAEHQELGGGVSWWLRDSFCSWMDLGLSFRSDSVTWAD